VLPTSAESGGGLEQSYELLAWVARSGARRGLDPSRIALGGDASGGALAAGLALAVKERCGPMLAAQFLLCPGGLFAPPIFSDRTSVLTGLPPTLVIIAEAALPSDDGCAYAAALLAAGVRAVAVRYLGTRHGFPWSDVQAPATRAVVDQAAQFLIDAFWLSPAAGIAAGPLPRAAAAKDQGKPQGL
jgi:acetyl esterase